MAQPSPRASTPRQRSSRKQVLSPKKTKRKRVPKCDGCGKRDGEDVGLGAPPGVKVKLKICARCRGVAYCSPSCQKVRWPTHRLRCVRVDPPAPRAPPSPTGSTRSSRQHSIPGCSGTGLGARRRPSAALGVAPTPRNREHAPTRHPFFGSQNDAASSRSSRSPPPVPHGASSGQRVQHQHQQPAVMRDGSPSPPPFDRLSMAHGLQSSGDNSRGKNPVKIIRMSSANRVLSSRAQQQHRADWGKAGSPPDRKVGPFSRENRTHSERIIRVPTSTRDRMMAPRKFSPPSSSKARSNTYGPVTPLPRGDPPPLPPRQPSNDGDGSLGNRRMSVSLDEKHPVRVKGFAAATAAGANTRGPPPPYSLVAHRAQSFSDGKSPPHDGSVPAVPRAVSADGMVGKQRRAPPPVPKRPIPPPSVTPKKEAVVHVASEAQRNRVQDIPDVRSPATENRRKETEKPDSNEAQQFGEFSPSSDTRNTDKQRKESTTVREPGETYGRNIKSSWVSAKAAANAAAAAISALSSLTISADVRDFRARITEKGVEGVVKSESNDAQQLDSTRLVEDEAVSAGDLQAWSSSAAAVLSPSLVSKNVQDLRPPRTEERMKDADEPDSYGSQLGGKAAVFPCLQSKGLVGQEGQSDSVREVSSGSPATEEVAATVTVALSPPLGSENGLRAPLAKEGAKNASGRNLHSAAGAAITTKTTPAKASAALKASLALLDTKETDAELTESSEKGDEPDEAEKTHDGGLPHLALPRSGYEAGGVRVLASPSSTDSNAAAGALSRRSKPSTPKGPGSPQVRHSSPVVPSRPLPPAPISVGFVLGLSRSSMSDEGSPRGSRRLSPRPRPPGSPGPVLSPTSLFPKPPSVLPDVQEIDTASSPSSSHGDGTTTTSNATDKVSDRAEWKRAKTRAISPVRASPFVPVVEFSPEKKPPTPHCPGPRRTDTATFYQRRLGRTRDSGLPPASTTYLGRPAGFSVHVLVASAPTDADLLAPPDSPVRGDYKDAMRGSMTVVPPALKAARAERALRHAGGHHQPWVYYSSEERNRVANALRPGDVILLTPGRYEARSWGLQHLLSSVEIIGAGSAKACVVYNEPSPTGPGPCTSHPQAEHYLIGIMGDAAAYGSSNNINGARLLSEEMKYWNSEVDDDSDSGWEDGALGAAAAASNGNPILGINHGRRAVRVRLANLTLEQGSGYRGVVYQLGRESHLELDGCVVRCSQSGVNVDQGTCLICDCTIEGSEVFGVHIGGEGAVEHCCIRDCGRGGGLTGRPRRVSVSPIRTTERVVSAAAVVDHDDNDDADDGTNVNRAVGMPAVSFLQSSRVRARFNVIRENAGHAVQCRDAPLPGGEDKRAMRVRRAQVEAEEQLTAWLGRAAPLLREHLADQRRLGSLLTQGNLCQRNTGCEFSGNCTGSGSGKDRLSPMSNRSSSRLARAASASAAAKMVLPSLLRDGPKSLKRLGSGGVDWGGGRASALWNNDRPICSLTGEQEELPLPAAMTLRFLSTMDEGYVGSMREENARMQKLRAVGAGVG